MPKRTLLSILIFVLVLSAAGLVIVLMKNNLFFKADVLKTQEERVVVKNLNDRLLSAASKYKKSKKIEDMAELKDIAQSRKNKFTMIAKENPGEFMSSALPLNFYNQMPAEIKPSVEERFRSEGNLQVIIEDDFQEKVGKAHYYLGKLPEAPEIFIDGEAPTSLANRNVKLSGIKIQDIIVARSEDIVAVDSQEVAATVTPTDMRKIAVILINFQNDQTQTVTNDYIRQINYLNPNSVNNLWKEASFGKTIMSGIKDPNLDIYGWYTISYRNDDCSFSDNWWGIWGSAGDKMAAARDGFDPAAYTNVQYVFGNISTQCLFSARGSLGSGVRGSSWYSTYTGSGSTPIYYNSPTIAHEMGHNLGFYHANSFICADTASNPVPIGDNCKWSEYGDPYDIMGGGYYHYNNYYKTFRDWITSTNYQTVTQSGTYKIAPQEYASSGIQMIRIPKEIDPATNVVKKYFYLEYRKTYGFDSFANPGGIFIRIAPDITYGSMTDLLRAGASVATPTQWALKPDQIFNDSSSGVKITTTSVTDQEATVNITIDPTAVCGRFAPQVQIAGGNQGTTTGGKTLYYVIGIKNSDTLGCEPATYDLGYTADPNLSAQFNVSNLTLPPGATGTAMLSVTSPASTPQGFYFFTAKASHQANTALAGTSTAAYVVWSGAPTDCINQTPVVNITPTMSTAVNAGAEVSYTVTVTNASNSYCSNQSYSLMWENGSGMGIGWSFGFDQETLTSLASGTSSSTILHLTSPLSASAKVYPFAVRASLITSTLTTCPVPFAAGSGNCLGRGWAFYTIGSGGGGGTPDTTPPAVSITLPLSGANIKMGTKVNITANATDNVGVAKVEFYINGSLKATDTTSPYSYTWNTRGKGISAGTYTIVAKAYDAAGNISQSQISVVLTK
ncbi:MAG: Ig-like domain-containing protein [bacterium]|nr:Ig-like domain-containing protein [bacterium]